jgi:Putative prokaryotic signal transducing protein
MEALVPVSAFCTAPEAHVARNQLEAAGIPAYLDGEEGGSTLTLSNAAGVKVLVRRQDVKRALRVLAESEKQLEEALDQADPEEGTHDEDRQVMEQLHADREDDEQSAGLLTPGDRAADHAHRVAYTGMLVFPILSHLYSSWLLLRLRWAGQELTRGGEAAAGKARHLNAIFLTCGATLALIYLLPGYTELLLFAGIGVVALVYFFPRR